MRRTRRVLMQVLLVLAVLMLSTAVQQVSFGIAGAEAGGVNSRRFNIRDYGAVGDGITNDAPAIQAALEAAAPYGGVIYVPPGRYCVELDPETDPNPRFSIADNIVIRGAGQDKSIIAPKEAPVQWTVFAVQPHARVSFRDISIEGPWPEGHPIDDIIPPGEGSPRQLTAIRHLGVSGLLSLKRVQVHKLHEGIKIAGGTVDVVLSYCTFHHLSLYGLLAAGAGSITAYRTRFCDLGDPYGGPNIDPNAAGFYLKAPIRTIEIRQCEFNRITKYAIARYAGIPDGTIDVNIIQNQFHDCMGIFLDNAPTRAVIANNIFTAPFGSQKVGINTQASDVIITKNIFHTSNVGVLVQSSSNDNCRNVILSGNRFVIERDGTALGVEFAGNSDYPVIGCRIEKGQFEGSGAPGVGVITIHAVDTVIEDVKFDLAGGPGIWVKDGSDRLHIEHNSFIGDDGRMGGIHITELAANPLDCDVVDNYFNCDTYAIYSRVDGVNFNMNIVKNGEVRL